MTERQRALAAYIRTLGPSVARARTLDQFVGRLMASIQEDGVFLASQFAQGLLVQGKHKVNDAAPVAVKAITDVVTNVATEWLKSLTLPKRGR